MKSWGYFLLTYYDSIILDGEGLDIDTTIIMSLLKIYCI